MNFEHFANCAEDAPEGMYRDVKDIRNVIGDAADDLIYQIRRLGFKANNCDGIYQVEEAIYKWIVESNPDDVIFPTAEDFGEAMTGDFRDQVIARAIANRDELRELGLLPGKVAA